MRDEFDRWSSKVEVTPGCWLWKGSKYRNGYGHFRRKIKDKWVMFKAHRYSYERYKGPIPEGHLVRHTCNIPNCVNPAHLLTGTHKDNVMDAIISGTKSWGRNANHRHLDLQFARQVRITWNSVKPYATQKEVAALHGISKQQCSRILRNEIWAEEN